MFRGGPGLTSDQLASLTAALGGRANAETRQTVTQYESTVRAEDLDLVLRAEALRMRALDDSDEVWAKERGAIEQEVAEDLSNPEYVFFEKAQAALFAGTPYALDPLGTRPSFEKTTGAMLREFHGAWYAPNDAIVVVAGDVDPARTIAEIEKLFGDVPRKPIPTRPTVVPGPPAAAAFSLASDKPYGTVALALRFPGTDSPDLAAATVLEDVLASPRGPLYALAANGKALFTEFAVDGFPAAGVAYAMAGFPKGANPAKLLADVRSALAEIRDHGVSSDMVEAAKRRALTRAEIERSSVADLAMRWSEALAVEGRSSPDEDLEALRRVTAEEVGAVARRVLDLDHAVTATLTPESSATPSSGKTFGGSESFAREDTAVVAPPDWAARVLELPSVPQSRLRPTTTTLPNGLRLVVQPENTGQLVRVFGRVRSDPTLEAAKGKDGVDEVLDALFAYGSTTLDRIAYQRALDALGAEASLGVGFSLDVLAEEFDRGVDLLADGLLHPALPKDAFAIVRDQVAGIVAGRLHSPEYLTRRALQKSLLPAHDAALREATPASVRSLSLSDVEAYRRKVFRPDLATIVVIGAVTPEHAAEAVTRAFGGWAADRPTPVVDPPPIPRNAARSTIVPDASRVQVEATLAESLGLSLADPDRFALELGNRVLGGSSFATRLYRDLREREALVYYAMSDLDLRRTRSFFGVRFGCDPAKLGRARALIEREIDRLRTEPIGDAELAQTKALLLRELPLSESSLEEIGKGLLQRATDDRALDEPTIAAGRYRALGAEEVRRAFAKWILPEILVSVAQGPAR